MSERLAMQVVSQGRPTVAKAAVKPVALTTAGTEKR
jgi:hypothetical protein